MAGGITQLRGFIDPQGSEHTDAELLEAFIADRHGAAFETLLRRHGPMVMGVCRRILPGWHDAEDAFQATFLVLARKAESVAPRTMVANWLHGVAHHTAVKLRAMNLTRALKERTVAKSSEPEPVPTDDTRWRELRPVIDEELSRLPEKYRMPILLCDIEEQSYKGAAAQLGWPEGTLAGRLSRARTLLAERLTRRGVVFTAAALALALQQGASARVSPALIPALVKAIAGATGSGVSANVAALAETVLKGMTRSTFKAVSAVLVTVIGLGAGAAFAANRNVPVEPVAPRPTGRAVLNTGSPPVRSAEVAASEGRAGPQGEATDLKGRDVVRLNGERATPHEVSAVGEPPVTLITSAVREDRGIRVRGSVAHTSDIKQVLVNGKPARSTRGSFAEWEVVIDAPAGGPIELTASATDVKGRADASPHTIRVE